MGTGRHNLRRSHEVTLSGSFRRGAILSLVAVCLAACEGKPQAESAGSPAATTGTFQFEDVAEEAGLTRVVLSGRAGKDHLLDSAGTGVGWLDYDQDGFLDAYVVNAWRIEENAVVEKGENALYRNDGRGGFVDVTREAGVTGEGHWGSGLAVADYDDDGDPDLLVTNFGPNLLYRNDSKGRFENVAGRLGIEVPGWNTGASFFDADGDGDLDLYIARYIDCSMEEVLAAECSLDWKGVAKVATGPFGLPGARDYFFLADGKGGFQEATEEAGLIDQSLGYGFGVRALDVEPDGDVDLYVANDSDANYVYRNEGDGTFQDVGMWAGAAFDENGAAQAGMGVAAGDANGDGIFDLFVTNFSEDFCTLYLGDGQGFFTDASKETGLGPATYMSLSWGAVLADFDRDGDQDLVIANGHIYPQVDDHPEKGQSYRQIDHLFENLGDGRFDEVSGTAGQGFTLKRSSRGVAAGDYDNDGDLDLLVSALDEPPALLRNDTPAGHWLTVILEQAPGRGTTLGSRVTVRTGDLILFRDASSGGSFLSVHDPRMHFGLGSHETVDSVEVRWPDGELTKLEQVPADQFLRVSR